MQGEKRKYTRVPVYMKVINETRESDFGFSYAKDISSGGMALETKIFLEEGFNLRIGDTLKLKFKIPGGRFYITALAEVVRIDKHKKWADAVGVKFTSMEDDFRKEIENFVNQMRSGSLSLE